MKRRRVVDGPRPDPEPEFAEAAFSTQAPAGTYEVALYEVLKWTALFGARAKESGQDKGSDLPRHLLVFKVLGVVEAPDAFAPGLSVDLGTLVGQRPPYFVRGVRADRRPSLRSRLASDYRQITAKAPPAHLGRIPLRDLYGGGSLIGLVRVVARNSAGDEVPAGARYSVIDRILGPGGTGTLRLLRRSES